MPHACAVDLWQMHVEYKYGSDACGEEPQAHAACQRSHMRMPEEAMPDACREDVL